MGDKHNPSETFGYQPFEHLKKIMELKSVTRTAISKPREPEKKTDEEIFKDAMKEVLEIEEFRNIPFPNKKALPVRKIHPDAEESCALEEIVRGKRPINLRDTQEYVEWSNKGYRGEILRKLGEGRFSVQDCLDLHGYTLDEARAEVDAFLKGAIMKKGRCVKIIHGRGLRSPNGPVLKQALVKWLTSRFRKHVIAFSTARQCDGGLGAIYILLR